MDAPTFTSAKCVSVSLAKSVNKPLTSRERCAVSALLPVRERPTPVSDINAKVSKQREDKSIVELLRNDDIGCPHECLCEEAATEIERLWNFCEWKPIESAPRDGTQILAWWKKSNEAQVVYFSAEKSRMGDRWCNECGYISDPTHWMPVPAAPLD